MLLVFLLLTYPTNPMSIAACFFACSIITGARFLSKNKLEATAAEKSAKSVEYWMGIKQPS